MGGRKNDERKDFANHAQNEHDPTRVCQGYRSLTRFNVKYIQWKNESDQ